MNKATLPGQQIAPASPRGQTTKRVDKCESNTRRGALASCQLEAVDSLVCCGVLHVKVIFAQWRVPGKDIKQKYGVRLLHNSFLLPQVMTNEFHMDDLSPPAPLSVLISLNSFGDSRASVLLKGMSESAIFGPKSDPLVTPISEQKSAVSHEV